MSEKGKILVVDDEAAIRDATSMTLQMAGYTVVEAADGEEALAQVDLEKPDLVLLDLMMPKINGMEVCRILRDNPETCWLPIIILSALQEKKIRIEGLEQGANVYLDKPFNEKELLAHIKNLISNRLAGDSMRETIKNRLQYEIHDLKTPLVNILHAGMLLENNRQAPPPDLLEELLAIMMNNARFMLSMITNMLDVSMMETRGAKPRLEPFNPYEAVLSSANQIKWSLREKNLRLETLREDAPEEIVADREMIIRVIINLLSNAIKFSPQGGEIRISLSREQNALRCVVQDEGEGITPEVMAHLFQQYNHSPSKDALNYASGLGLAYSRMVIEAHGGHIGADSPPGKGTKFFFTVPLKPQPSSLPAA